MSNYTRGRALEYDAKRYFEERGYLVVRSAGSKSPVDLVCLHPSYRLLLVQCKYGAGKARQARQRAAFSACTRTMRARASLRVSPAKKSLLSGLMVYQSKTTRFCKSSHQRQLQQRCSRPGAPIWKLEESFWTGMNLKKRCRVADWTQSNFADKSGSRTVCASWLRIGHKVILPTTCAW
ncbi:MAG: hypothetical protein KatS3mg038_3638 [Candidatus Kapaibacterium sp.]|nr:MAG: hypothetical protein KatS3mg038_3638 [Candidatus Kapabacteria bacterium]